MESLEIFESFDCECCASVALIVLEKLFDGDFGFYVIVGVKILGLVLDITSTFGELDSCSSYECDLSKYWYYWEDECLCYEFQCETANNLFYYLLLQRVLAGIFVCGYLQCWSNCKCGKKCCTWCRVAREKELEALEEELKIAKQNEENKQNRKKQRAHTTSNAGLPETNVKLPSSAPSETQNDTDVSTDNETDNENENEKQTQKDISNYKKDNNNNNQDNNNDNNNNNNNNDSENAGTNTNDTGGNTDNNTNDPNEATEVVVDGNNTSTNINTTLTEVNEKDNDNNNNNNNGNTNETQEQEKPTTDETNDDVDIYNAVKNKGRTDTKDKKGEKDTKTETQQTPQKEEDDDEEDPAAKSFGGRLMIKCHDKTIELCNEKCGPKWAECCQGCFKYTEKGLNCIFRKEENPTVRSNLAYGSKWNGMDAFCKIYSANYQDNLKQDWKIIFVFIIFVFLDLLLVSLMSGNAKVTVFLGYAILQGFIGQVEWIMVLCLVPAKQAKTCKWFKTIIAYLFMFGFLTLLIYAYDDLLRTTSLYNYERRWGNTECTEWEWNRDCDYTYGVYYDGFFQNSTNTSAALCPGVFTVEEQNTV